MMSIQVARKKPQKDERAQKLITVNKKMRADIDELKREFGVGNSKKPHLPNKNNPDEPIDYKAAVVNAGMAVVKAMVMAMVLLQQKMVIEEFIYEIPG